MKLLLLAALSIALYAQTGPEVGSAIPPFEAKDQNGQTQSLKSIAGPKGALLVFHRSADWCPFCKMQLVELQRDLPRLKAEGIGLAAISYDSVEILKSFAARRGITFPLLADPDSKIIRAFGILNESAPKNTPFWGVTRPGTYLVNPDGIVLSKRFSDDAAERDTAAEVLTQRLGSGSATTTGTRHLRLTTYSANQTVHQGQHVTLSVDLVLNPRMHVYAPSVHEGYIPIDWKVSDGPDYKVTAVDYPKPQTLRLDAINETVPVYAGKLHLTREIVIGPVKAPHEVIVEGSLRYQACDDHECYLPVTLPLKWTFQFAPLDTERVPTELRRR
jgi:peroxiredoxin